MGYIGEMIINSKKLEAVDVISFDILIHCLNEMFQTIVKYLILLKRNLEYLDSQKKRIEAAHRAENKAINGEATYEENICANR